MKLFVNSATDEVETNHKVEFFKFNHQKVYDQLMKYHPEVIDRLVDYYYDNYSRIGPIRYMNDKLILKREIVIGYRNSTHVYEVHDISSSFEPDDAVGTYKTLKDAMMNC